jgi:hypothetical protein
LNVEHTQSCLVARTKFNHHNADLATIIQKITVTLSVLKDLSFSALVALQFF